ncbi:cytochrome D ubiquinol oxidase subunit II [Reticulibacter mediterranei]|uniref:Cytochrome D ubiquinol oxidase subunit II n=1 Tax=Reticulibacter mediterranei TaxID=2778369 RepID=A0A8J3IB88_9CHLR|nr:cytochrome d ubiquinol oxidase subunit II [Reticulibacter mediterranei]GHO92204.1 cytochrome D ubiquinol oxidase subunit II [Reticulibacter mediterranei]
MQVAVIALCVLWAGMMMYALTGGADFGSGIWDFLAIVSRKAEKQQAFITHSLSPIWEANHVWLIFLIIGLFSTFPGAFFILSIALFTPLLLVLLGIVIRGSMFVFRSYSVNASGWLTRVWSWLFGLSSMMTPFFFGLAAALVAGGNIRADGRYAMVTLSGDWASPFVLTIGVAGVVLCATIAAVYLMVEASNRFDGGLINSYRKRALIAGGLLFVCLVTGLVLASSEATFLWQGMVQRTLPLTLGTLCAGVLLLVALWMRQYRLSRLFVILQTLCLFVNWGLAQVPYIVPPHLTIANTANDPGVIRLLLMSMGILLAIVLPSLYCLYAVFKRHARMKSGKLYS